MGDMGKFHGGGVKRYKMKVVILAGGRGTRISEESLLKPKPMIEIGNKPILWHIMKGYSVYGFNEFIICCGYKGQMIKDYFIHYYMYQSNSSFNLCDSSYKICDKHNENWKVTLVDTGLDTLTGGRILKIKEYIEDEEFLITYGDGVSDVNISKLIAFHHKNDSVVTITTTQPSGRFGAIKINKYGRVETFKEKARADQAWVNAGFMVMNNEIFDYLGTGDEMLENGPFESLARAGKMTAYKHDGFWCPMDTMKDKEYLEHLWNSGSAPWKTWVN